MKIYITLLLALAHAISFAQTPITVTENTFRIKSNAEELFYFGFAEGDQMVFSFEEVNNNSLKIIEFGTYNTAPFFAEHKVKKIANKTIRILKTGVYQFRLVNNGILGRTCVLKIQRIPASEKTTAFSSTVYWRTAHDTIHTKNYEKYTIKKDTAAVSLIDQITKVSSKNAINGNNNTTIVDFSLPKNTVSWSYYIGVGNEGAKAYTDAKESFLKSAVKVISTFSGYGIMAELGLHGVNMFQKAQGGDNIKYWFIQDEKSVKAFRNNQKFYQYKQGDVVNDASQMKKPLVGKVYLGLQNDNLIEPVEVFVKVTAITVNETKVYNKPTLYELKSRQEPYLKN